MENDFIVDPVPLALTFARLAIDKGVKIIEDCHVKEILTEKQRAGQYDRVTSAITSQGDIKCDVFINCTGLVNLFFLTHSSFEINHLFSGLENLVINLPRKCVFLHKLVVRLFDTLESLIEFLFVYK